MNWFMDTFASKKNLYAYIYTHTRQRKEKKQLALVSSNQKDPSSWRGQYGLSIHLMLGSFNHGNSMSNHSLFFSTRTCIIHMRRSSNWENPSTRHTLYICPSMHPPLPLTLPSYVGQIIQICLYIYRDKYNLR